MMADSASTWTDRPRPAPPTSGVRAGPQSATLAATRSAQTRPRVAAAMARPAYLRGGSGSMLGRAAAKAMTEGAITAMRDVVMIVSGAGEARCDARLPDRQVFEKFKD